MSRIALLTKATPRFEDDNYLRFGRLLSTSNEVSLVNFDSLQLRDNAIWGQQFPWQDYFQPGAEMPVSRFGPIEHDLVWTLSLGDRSSFLDKYQLLYALSKQTTVINSLTALMHLKSKYYLASRPEQFRQPETHASSSASELIKLIRHRGGKWIVKPPAGSLGRDVFLVSPRDTNLNTILEHMCGPDEARYAMIQRYAPQIEAGEKRVLLAGGRIIDQYRRLQKIDHRTNVSQGASTEHCKLTAEERDYCSGLAEELLDEGVYFSGIDLAWPWLIETNVVNPGGIITLQALTGQDRTEDVLSAILESLKPKGLRLSFKAEPVS